MLVIRWPANSTGGIARSKISSTTLSALNVGGDFCPLTSFLATITISHILLIHQDTPLFHQPDLFIVVRFEVDLGFGGGGGGLSGGGHDGRQFVVSVKRTSVCG